MELNVLPVTDSDVDDAPYTCSTEVQNLPLQSNCTPRFFPASPPINWGSKHPDYGNEKTKRAKWSDEELHYLSNLIASLTSKDTSQRFKLYL